MHVKAVPRCPEIRALPGIATLQAPAACGGGRGEPRHTSRVLFCLQEGSEEEEDVGRHRKNEKSKKTDVKGKGKGKKKKRGGFIDDAAEEVGRPDRLLHALGGLRRLSQHAVRPG